MCKTIKKTYLIEVNLQSVGANAQNRIGDVPALRNKKITAIEVYSAAEVSVAPSGGTMIVAADLPKLGLTVINQETTEEFIRQMPLFNLNPPSNGGLIRAMDPTPVQFEKSYLTVFDTTGLAAAEKVCLNVHYQD
jgi:hypothetical protein